MRLNLKRQSGFTLVEVTIILLVLVILATIMLPQLGNFNRLARFVKVREDVGAICSVMKKMLDEVMLGTFYKNPKQRREPVGLLVGPGDIPINGGAGDGTCVQCSSPQDLNWRRHVNETGLMMKDDVYMNTGQFVVGELQNHLQQNQPDPSNYNYRYKNPTQNPQRWAAGAFFGWRGPYLDELTTDPWNNRYMVNSFALYKVPNTQNNSAGGLFSSAVVCYSAGPDGAIDTVFNQPAIGPGNQANGWVWGDDDMGAVFSAGGPF